MEKKTISTPVAIAIAVGVLIIVGLIGFVSINHANGPTLSPAEVQANTDKAGDAAKQAQDAARQRFSSGSDMGDPAVAAQKRAQEQAQQRYGGGGAPGSN